MYNWSVDEKQFKKVDEIITFLKIQPEVLSIKRLNKKNGFGNIMITTRLSPDIHPVRRTFFAHYLAEKTGKLRVSVYENDK